MTEPTIICPNCKTEIRLTKSLAAPLIAATRRQFEQQLLQCANDNKQKKLTKQFIPDLGFTVHPLSENIGHRVLVYVK